MRPLRTDVRHPLLLLPLIAALLVGCEDRKIPTGPTPRAVARSMLMSACVVTNILDAGPGSLRDAIANPACTTITFDPSLNGKAITLTSGQLSIDRGLSIEGPGPAQLAVVRSSAAGTADFRIFEVGRLLPVSISGLRISGGKAPAVDDQGGGIASGATLTLTNVVVSGNSATGSGGGIVSGAGQLTILNSTISNNVSGDRGGGIRVLTGGATITGTTISSNRAVGGGGIATTATVLLTNSTVSGNFAFDNAGNGAGGGVWVTGSSSTGMPTLDHVTVVDNTTDGKGGGIFILGSSATVTLRGTIVARNTATSASSPFTANDIEGLSSATVTANYSLISIPIFVTFAAGSGNNIFATPNLGLLQNNGGPTFTHALLPGSAGINAGDNASCPATDQRGFTRPASVADACDMGAYELTAVATTTTLASSRNPSTFGNSVTFTASVTSAGAAVTAGSVDFIDGGTCASPGTPLASNVVLNSSGQSSFATGALNVGNHSITGCYRGATGFSPSSGNLTQQVAPIFTRTSVSVTPSTQQYSDNVTITASITPSSATGTVGFFRSTDGGATYTAISGSVAVASGSASITYKVVEAAGTAVRFKASYFSNSANFENSPGSAVSLTVTKENATVLDGGNNPVALQVSSPGGPLNAGALTLLFSVKETTPDLAAATAAVGSISNAGLSVVLAPVAPGSSYSLTCTPGAIIGSGYDATRPFSCTNATAISVNAYEVQANVAGNFYTGSYSDALTVFDPSLGFAAGGGAFTLGDDRVTVALTMKYNKGSSNPLGNVLVVRHHPDGTVSRLKANSLGSLAIGQDASVPMGWATLSGKATYTRWDAAIEDYVTVGNQNFALYAEDRGEPGANTDRIWISGPGDVSMPGALSTAAANAQTLTGGNISIPHGSEGKP